MVLKPIDKIPNGLELSIWSQFEFDATTQELRDILQQQSRSMWTSHNSNNRTIAILGVHVPTEGRPELWALITREFRAKLKSNLPVLKEHVEYIMNLYPKVILRVDSETPLGRKFVEYLGFAFTREESNLGGRDYYVYEASAWPF